MARKIPKRPKRKIVQDPKGRRGKDFMSEKSITTTSRKINKGRPTNIPSVFGGKVRSEKEAVKRIHQSGGIDPENPHRGKIKSFKDIPTAVKSAKNRSKSFRKTRSLDILKARLKGSGKRKGKSSRK